MDWNCLSFHNFSPNLSDTFVLDKVDLHSAEFNADSANSYYESIKGIVYESYYTKIEIFGLSLYKSFLPISCLFLGSFDQIGLALCRESERSSQYYAMC